MLSYSKLFIQVPAITQVYANRFFTGMTDVTVVGDASRVMCQVSPTVLGGSPPHSNQNKYASCFVHTRNEKVPIDSIGVAVDYQNSRITRPRLSYTDY